jgi:hypothetical protein
MRNLFRLNKEERWVALVTLIVVGTLFGMMVRQYSPLFLKGGNLGFWSIFERNFRMSGYDCWSWITISNLRVHFETMRHPLFLSILYPLYGLNHWLMGMTGTNYAVFLFGTLTTFCAVYTMVFSYRLQREIIGLPVLDAVLLCLLFYGMGHVMVTMIVPDHFGISMFLLTLTLYMVGHALKNGRAIALWKWSLLLFLTAGMTLTNGAKTLLAALFVDGRRMFRFSLVVLGIVLPLAMLGGIYALQYQTVEVPQQAAIHRIEQANLKKHPEKVRKHNLEREKWIDAHRGKPASDLPLLNMTDVSTPRMESVVENFFGESIQLHRGHLLEDMSFTRPIFVRYDSIVNYIVEGMIVLLFALSLWTGRRERLLQMCMSWFAVDVLLHFGLGFGLNEVYIMAGDWIFIIPLAMGYLLLKTHGKLRFASRLVIGVLAFYLLAWNGTLLVSYLLTPMSQIVK